MLPGQKVIRPAEHLVHGVDGPIAVIDGQICAILERLLDLKKVRGQVRGQDAQLDHSLIAIRLAALAYDESSARGTHVAPQPEPAARSSQQQNDETVSTTTASAFLGITDRAVRKAITEKRLPATKVEGRWRVTREDLFEYRNRR
jgi:excisionase family DNA binding protein